MNCLESAKAAKVYDVYIRWLPLKGLEQNSIPFVRMLRSQHTATLVVERDTENSSQIASTRCIYIFDVIPSDATNPLNIVKLLCGQNVKAIVRAKQIELSTPFKGKRKNLKYVGEASCEDPVLSAKSFNATWSSTINLYNNTSCRHHTCLLVSSLLKEESDQIWQRLQLGRLMIT